MISGNYEAPRQDVGWDGAESLGTSAVILDRRGERCRR